MSKEAENETPVFKECRGGKQFFVTIPNNLRGKWMDALAPAYNQGKKAYVFSMTQISDVEKGLGLATGESGLRDPTKYFHVTFDGEFYSEAGFDALKEYLADKGFTWRQQYKRFEGSLSNLEAVKDKVAK